MTAAEGGFAIEIHDVTTGKLVARADIEGPADSLLALANRLSLEIVPAVLDEDEE